MELVIAAVVAVVLAVASGAICFRFGISYRKKIAEAEITSAEAEAKRIVDEAIKVVRELRNHMNKANAEMALRDPYTVEDNESISMTEIEETIRNLEFIKDICEIV